MTQPQYSPFQPQPEPEHPPINSQTQPSPYFSPQTQLAQQSVPQSAPQPLPPTAQGPFPQRPSQLNQPNQPKHSSIQILLLILGVALATIAVLAFASFAYGLLGDIGRAVCIGVVGIAALIVGMLLTKRLRVTAEGLTWAGLAALTIDAVLISDIPPVALLVSDDISSGIIILLITALAYVLRLIAAHMPDASRTANTDSNQPAAHESSNEKGSAQSLPLRASTLYAMCALPFAVMSLFSAPL